MAVKVKTKSKVKASSNGKKELTRTEKKKLAEGCIQPGAPGCPLVNHKDSPYMYQEGCRALACKTANRVYYKNWRDERKAQAEKDARKKARAKNAKKKTAKR